MLTTSRADGCFYEFAWRTAAACVLSRTEGDNCTVFDSQAGACPSALWGSLSCSHFSWLLFSGCAGSSLLLRLCSGFGDRGATHCSGFSCEVWASVVVEHGLSCHAHVGSSRIRDRALCPALAGRSLTTESPEKACLFSNIFSLSVSELITCFRIYSNPV